MLNHPAYFGILPANVRYCKDIEPAAKVFYSEISALCGKEGYCWASNKYFTDLYDVDERTIRNWLSSLSEHKFIFVLLDKQGMQTTRRIFISGEAKEKFTTGKKIPDGGKKNSARPEKNFPHNNIHNNKQEEVVCCAEAHGENSVAPTPNTISCEIHHPDGKKTTLREENLYTIAVQKKKDWTAEEIEMAWKVLSDYKKKIRCWERFTEGVINNARLKEKSQKICGNQKEKICEKKIKEECHPKNLKNSSEKQKSEYTDQDMQMRPLAECFSLALQRSGFLDL